MKTFILMVFMIMAFRATGQEIFQKSISGLEKSVSIGLSDGGSINASHMSLQVGGIYDLVFTKHSSTGQIQFTKAYGSTDHEQIYDGKEYLGNYYFCGEYVSSSASKGLILKLDSDGNLVWAKTVPFATKLTALTILSTGNIAVTGTGKISTGSDFEIVTQKLDLNGNFIWGKYCVQSTPSDMGYSVIEFGTGGVLTVGKLYSGTGYPSGYYQAFNSSGSNVFGKIYSNSSFSDVFYNGVFYYLSGISNNIDSYPLLLKINASGDTLSTMTFGGYFNQMNVTDAFMFEGGIIYSGNTFSNSYYILKLDYNGNKLWMKDIKNTIFTGQTMHNTLLTANNRILITANHQNGSSNEMELISGDNTGDFGCNFSEYSGGYWHNNDPHNLTVGGTVQNISGTSTNLNLISLSAAIVDQVHCSSLEILETEETNPTLKIYPNPCNDYLFMDVSSDTYYEIMDITGKVGFCGFIDNGYLDVSKLDQGTYFLKIGNDVSKFIKL